MGFSSVSLTCFFTSISLVLLTWEAAAEGGVAWMWSSFFCLKQPGCLVLEDYFFLVFGTVLLGFFLYVRYQAVHQVLKVSHSAAGH